MSSFFLVIPALLIGFVVAAPIGPINLICIRRTLAFGSLNGFVSGLGATTGDGIFAAIIVFGLTAVRHWIEGYSQLLQIGGGALLLGFGVYTYLADPLHGRELQCNGDRAPANPSLLRSFASTFALSLSNPATLFAFAALFAGFGGIIASTGAHMSLSQAGFVVVGVLCGSGLWWLTLTTIVGALHARINTRVMRIITHVSGAVICVFGLGMLAHVLWEQFR
jgi:threonine/homoserine/homoserine lactone efflux protein